MSREWTLEQQRAIELKDRDLLVSAGAGSGKTSVMAERIIRRICDPEDPVRLDEMLIVTFTVAAAGELRERITAGLRERIALGGHSKLLIKQLDNIGSANISTINSFCLDIVRRNFARIGLPASMRVIDEAESDIINEEVMNEVLEEFFKDGESLGIKDFDYFCENFINERDESLAAAFLSIYKKLLSVPEGISLLDEKAKMLSDIDASNFFESPWGGVISQRVYSLYEYYKKVYEAAVDYFNDDDVLSYNYLGAFQGDLDLILSVVNNREELSYDELRKKLSEHSFVNLGRKKLHEDADRSKIEFFKGIRKKFKEDNTLLCKKTLLSMPGEKIPMLASLTAEVVFDLKTLLSCFEAKLKARKISMGVLTFSDSERYALELLVSENGEPTPIALEYRERFRQVYIDEYQDTNKLQDMIFSTISRPGARFMVGDIKQSIYAFRSADPALFANYRDEWKPYSENDSQSASSLYLSTNFRSSPRVLKTVNSIFSPLFTAAGNVNYREEDDLVIPDTKDAALFDKVKIAVVSKKDGSDEESTGTSSELHRDAEYVASEISRLSAEGEKLSDIAVLVRNRSLMQHIEAAFNQYGIPYDSASESSFFSTPEIRFVLSVLNVIDNPTREIHLAAVLASPLYRLTPDEIALLRIEADRGLSLYEIIESSENPKTIRFMRDLKVWREKAKRLPVDKLIRWLYNEYSIVNAACAGRKKSANQLIKINCEKLYDIARIYESSSYKGVYAFIEYINTLSKLGSGVAVPLPLSDNCVKIMTIHSSKGLEFKNCFIYGAANSLKKRGKGDEILFSKTLGFGMFVREKDSPYRFDTPFRTAIACDNENCQLEEEIRILYVALTRAKERLWIVGTASKPDDFISSAVNAAEYFESNTVLTQQNYLFWAICALSARVPSGDWDIFEITDSVDVEFKREVLLESADAEDPAKYAEALKTRFEFKYGADVLGRIPAKLSVSRLYPEVLDEPDYSTGLRSEVSQVRRRPVFEGGLEDNRAASIGTATHLFMQFCDFNILVEKGVLYEINRLCELKFLSDEIAGMVSVAAIERFMKSELFFEILGSSQVWRERRFNVLLPAERFATDPRDKNALKYEKMLVQGVVDCVFTDPCGNLVLVDYKTDSVRGMIEEDAVLMLRNRHSLQLTYYKEALEKLTGRKISRTVIYSFGLGRALEI